MFVRVISSRQKWARIPSKPTRFPADCFFDIRTTRNTLSLWQYTDTDDAETVTKCIVVAALGRKQIDKVSYVVIEDSELSAESLQFTQDDPQCSFLNPDKQDFITRHFDIKQIDDQDLLKIAKIVMNKIESGQIQTLTKEKVKNAFEKMRDENLLINKGLDEGISSVLFPVN